MKLLFVDETSDTSNPNYLGLCFAFLDSTKYRLIKDKFIKHLESYQWDKDIEFKGRWIFSASKGCEQVPVEERIQLTEEIIKLNTSGAKSRIKFLYMYTESGSGNKEYLKLLELGLGQVLPRAPKGMGKNVIGVYCDERKGIRVTDVRDKVEAIIKKKKYILLEDPHLVNSTAHTVGICVADIVAYLMSRVDIIKVDSSLFEDLTSEKAKKNMQLKKYLTSKRLIRSIRKMDVYKAIRKTN